MLLDMLGLDREVVAAARKEPPRAPPPTPSEPRCLIASSVAVSGLPMRHSCAG